jgi:hypothetical protein
MGLWAGRLGEWARGGRWGKVTLLTISESGLGCWVWSFILGDGIYSTLGSGVSVREARRGGNPVAGFGRRAGGFADGRCWEDIKNKLRASPYARVSISGLGSIESKGGGVDFKAGGK